MITPYDVNYGYRTLNVEMLIEYLLLPSTNISVEARLAARNYLKELARVGAEQKAKEWDELQAQDV